MIAFRKPFSKPVQGVVINSIVAYWKKPYSYGDNYDEFVHRLYIDLWLAVLQFEWIRKKNK